MESYSSLSSNSSQSRENSQFNDDSTAYPTASDLDELQRLLLASESHLEFDAPSISIILSKDVKALQIQTSYRGHLV